MSLGLPAAGELLAVCIAALIFFSVGCATLLGSSFRTAIEDGVMVVLTEGTAQLAFHSPIDWMRLHGRPLTDWPLIAGTGLALIGILLNHLAQRSGPGRNRWRIG